MIPVEVNSWSLFELQTELERVLPQNAELQISSWALGWRVTYLTWEEIGPDLRLLLLSLYTWFCLKDHTNGSLWVHKEERGLITVSLKLNIPDPEDLDPKEVDRCIEDHT
jgi:hypothetical protein